MDVKAYEAAIIAAKINGMEAKKELNQVVEDILKGNAGKMKTEEIIMATARETGIMSGPELQGKVAAILNKLKEDDKIVHEELGYWKIK